MANTFGSQEHSKNSLPSISTLLANSKNDSAFSLPKMTILEESNINHRRTVSLPVTSTFNHNENILNRSLSSTGHRNSNSTFQNNSHENGNVSYPLGSTTKFGHNVLAGIHLPSPMTEQSQNTSFTRNLTNTNNTYSPFNTSFSYSVPCLTSPLLTSEVQQSNKYSFDLHPHQNNNTTLSSHNVPLLTQPLVTPRASKTKANLQEFGTDNHTSCVRNLANTNNALNMVTPESSLLSDPSCYKNTVASLLNSNNNHNIASSTPYASKYTNTSSGPVSLSENDDEKTETSSSVECKNNITESSKKLRFALSSQTSSTHTSFDSKKKSNNRSEKVTPPKLKSQKGLISTIKEDTPVGAQLQKAPLNIDANVPGEMVVPKKKFSIFYDKDTNSHGDSHSDTSLDIRGKNQKGKTNAKKNSTNDENIGTTKKTNASHKSGTGGNKVEFAFISHSQKSFSQEEEPDIDNAQLARRKRRRTSRHELSFLEAEFAKDSIPNKLKRKALAEKCKMTETSVQIWFQNKRQSLKKKRKLSEKNPNLP
ncbi:hypothetical protein ACO0QE_000703 [Hanseniaspora vineae]